MAEFGLKMATSAIKKMAAAKSTAPTKPQRRQCPLSRLAEIHSCQRQEEDDFNDELGFDFIRSHGEALGSGSQGSVTADYGYSAGEVVACKTIVFKPKSVKSVSAERECEALRKLEHPNIVKYLYATQPRLRSPIQKEIRIYMEYCEHGSLRDFIDVQVLARRTALKPDFVKENYIWHIILQVAAALQYCHFGVQADSIQISDWKPVLHRDIKPGNILLASTSTTAYDAIKLADFGLSVTLEGTAEFSSYIGTKMYTAPEISSNTEKIRWTTACDIFSLGVTLYELCTFSLPFKYRRTSEEETFEPISTHYSQGLSTCIASCMSFNPTDRPDASELFNIAKIATQKELIEMFKILNVKSVSESQIRPQVPQLPPTTTQLQVHPAPSVPRNQDEPSNTETSQPTVLCQTFKKNPNEKLPYLSLDAFPNRNLRKSRKIISKSSKRPVVPGKKSMPKLESRDQVFLIDDASPMEPVWDAMYQLLNLLARDVKSTGSSGPDPMDIFQFINRSKFKKEDLIRTNKRNTRRGPNNLSARLHVILKDYMASKLRPVAFPGHFVPLKPLSLHVLTAAHRMPNSSSQGAVKNTVNSLVALDLPASHVGIQFISFGESQIALERLRKHDSRLGLDLDIVDHNPSDGNLQEMLFRASKPGGGGDGAQQHAGSEHAHSKDDNLEDAALGCANAEEDNSVDVAVGSAFGSTNNLSSVATNSIQRARTALGTIPNNNSNPPPNNNPKRNDSKELQDSRLLAVEKWIQGMNTIYHASRCPIHERELELDPVHIDLLKMAVEDPLLE